MLVLNQLQSILEEYDRTKGFLTYESSDIKSLKELCKRFSDEGVTHIYGENQTELALLVFGYKEYWKFGDTADHMGWSPSNTRGVFENFRRAIAGHIYQECWTPLIILDRNGAGISGLEVDIRRILEAFAQCDALNSETYNKFLDTFTKWTPQPGVYHRIDFEKFLVTLKSWKAKEGVFTPKILTQELIELLLLEQSNSADSPVPPPLTNDSSNAPNNNTSSSSTNNTSNTSRNNFFDSSRTEPANNVNRFVCEQHKNPYNILGVARTADNTEIKKRYSQLTRMFHPDKNKGIPTDMFNDISQSYELLSDDKARNAVDMVLAK